MYGADQSGTCQWIHAAPGQPYDPGGHPRAKVHDVKALAREPFAQWAHMAQGQGILAAQVPGMMFGFLLAQAANQSTSPREHC